MQVDIRKLLLVHSSLLVIFLKRDIQKHTLTISHCREEISKGISCGA